MGKRFIIISLVLLLASCKPDSTATVNIQNSSTNVPATIFPDFTPTLTPTFTPYPTPTNLPPVEKIFYQLQLEYSTSSDWTSLEIAPVASLLTYSLVSITGNPEEARVVANPDGGLTLRISRPPNTLSKNPIASMVVNLVLSIDAPGETLHFVQSKGAWNSSSVRILTGSQDNLSLIRQYNQEAEYNRFDISLSKLSQYPPRSVQIQTLNNQRLVWAVYYPWYLGDQTGYCGWLDPIYTDKPVNHYVSNDPTAIAQQIEQAQSAGIDGFLVSAFDDPNFIQEEGLDNLIRIANDRNFSVGIFMEDWDSSNLETGIFSRERISNWLAWFFETYGDQPSVLRAAGKPVIFVYQLGNVPLSFWQSILTDLESNGHYGLFLAPGYNPSSLAVFDGIFEYGVVESLNYSDVYKSIETAVENYPILDPTHKDKIWVASVMPGFDNTPLVKYEGWQYNFTDRVNGEFYRRTWEAALKSGADWVMIITWNEYQENTHIEPSEQYGDLYLQITSEYVLQWKNIH